jgi:hypothetical protein
MKVAGWWCCAAAVSSCLLIGCNKKTNVVEVTGKVTRNGKVVPNLYLNFVPDEGRPSWAMTDDNGDFKLNYDKERDGAQVGTHTVWVQVRGRSPKEEGELADRVKKSPDLQAILEKYGDAKKSNLRIEITPDTKTLEVKLD